jgi:hypothetical protein
MSHFSRFDVPLASGTGITVFVGRQMRLLLSDGIQRVQFSEPIRVLDNDFQELYNSACFSALWNSATPFFPPFTEFAATGFDAVSGVGD